MSMHRVTTALAGPSIQGGGVQEFYFESEVGFEAGDAASTALAFWTALTSYVLTGHTAVVSGDVEQLDEVNGTISGVTPVTGGTVTFSRTGTVMPFAVNGLIQWRTGEFSDGREIRGRTFIPGLTQDLGTAGAPTSAYLTALAAAVTAFLAPTDAAPVIWRRPRPARPQVGSPGDAWYLPAQTQRDGSFGHIQSGTPWTKFAQLRSRRD